jgi:predicted metal-dependent enzyme (double-stranded beta helix superfamily)
MGDVSSGHEEQEARLVTLTEPTVGSRRCADPDASDSGSPSRLGMVQLVDIVRSVAVLPERWRPRVRHQIDRRNYEDLVLAEDYEVLLICWDIGQMTLLHDHDSSVGAFVVVEGSLLEDYGRAGSSSLRQRWISRGRVCSFGPGYIHNLANPGPGLATSIHAYSPRISMLNYYAVLPGGAVRVRSLSVDHPEPPAP